PAEYGPSPAVPIWGVVGTLTPAPESPAEPAALRRHHGRMPKNTPILLAALGFAALLQPACSKHESAGQAVENTKAVAKDAAVAVQETAADSWDSIKDYTYEKRADFADGLDRMAAKRDAEVAEWNARTARLPDTAAAAREKANQD